MSKIIIFLKFILVIFVSTSALAFEEDAKKFVQSTTDEAKKIILDKSIKLEDKKKEIEKIAINFVDVDGLGKFTLGSERKNLNKEQLNQYTKTFRVFFAKNISSRLQNYSDQDIKVIGSKQISDNYVMVNSKMISKKEGQEIAVDWRVFKINDKLVVRDLVVEGLSLAKTQRQEFSSILASKGFDGLIKSLDEFILKN